MRERELRRSNVDVLSKASGQSHAVLALGWLLSRPAVASAIIGPETLDELEANELSAVVDLDLSAGVA